MAIDTIVWRLTELDALRGLSRGQIERLARDADRIIFHDGQTIAEAGAEGDGAFVLVSGRARALADPDQGLEARAIEAGSMIGELAMLTEHRYGITVLAEGEVRAIKIARETLRRQMLDDASLVDHFTRRLATRLTRVAMELRLIEQRLATVAMAS